MPVFDFECSVCGSIFDVLVIKGSETVCCPTCGGKNSKKLLSEPSVSIKKEHSTKGIEKRVNDYLQAGNFSEARKFADKAASIVKSDKIKTIQEKLHQKTGL